MTIKIQLDDYERVEWSGKYYFLISADRCTYISDEFLAKCSEAKRSNIIKAMEVIQSKLRDVL